MVARPDGRPGGTGLSSGNGPLEWFGLEVSWAPRDRWRTLTVLATVGVLLATGMAMFGLPPVDLHGPVHRAGLMDPFCGGTRATRFAARGQFGRAWTYNPLGIAVVLGAAALLVRAMVGVIYRRWLTIDLQLGPRGRRLVVALVVLLVVALEIRQQSRVDLLLVTG